MNFYTKLFSFVSTGLLLVLILASPASAHDPLILLPEQKTPLNGPFLPDGTISFALYGSLLEKMTRVLVSFIWILMTVWIFPY